MIDWLAAMGINLGDSAAWTALLSVILIDVTLAGDNAVLLAWRWQGCQRSSGRAR